jgi:hypothetical protein
MTSSRTTTRRVVAETEAPAKTPADEPAPDEDADDDDTDESTQPEPEPEPAPDADRAGSDEPVLVDAHPPTGEVNQPVDTPEPLVPRPSAYVEQTDRVVNVPDEEAAPVSEFEISKT